MKDPNSIKIFYPDKTVMTMGYVTISDLFEGLKKEIENVHRRQRGGKPLPIKIIITFDRRIRWKTKKSQFMKSLCLRKQKA